MDQELRPNPDSLLDIVSHDKTISKRGRLKIFFGGSAGVGKTYSMLTEAKQKLKDNIDLIIGIVETHGREETSALLDGLPLLPPIEINHRNIVLQEFDLEAAIVRKPTLILIDELAHTNAPGSRHPKRWQDVEELLSKGIDVFTTLNVQHLESINDMVAKLTGIQVRETVPDRIFDEADDIELIDLPSDELLKRLNEGKVYIAPNANKRAAENFFKKTNLVALRELALRRTAERVDAQMDILTAAQGQREAQIGQKILVCIGHEALSARVIRHSKRMATRAKAMWYAVYVETSRHYRLTDKARLAVDRNLRLAEQMGARIVILTGSNACEEILNFAKNKGFTRIVVGHRNRSRLMYFLHGSLSTELVLKGKGIEITTVTETSLKEKSYISIWRKVFLKPSSFFYAFLSVMFCTAFSFSLRDYIEPQNFSMFYITAVTIIAAYLGVMTALFSSILSVLLYIFFFTEPYYSFNFKANAHIFSLITMLFTSFVVGSLAAKLSHQARQYRKREEEAQSLYALTKELSSVRGIANMGEVAIKHIKEIFNFDMMILIKKDDGFSIYPEDSPFKGTKEESVAHWVLESNQIAGRNTDTLPSARGLYFPLLVEKLSVGVLGVIPKIDDFEFTTSKISQLETITTLVASAFQRANRAEAAEKNKIEVEGEKMRNVLLSSVSYDLRSPLAAITSAASNALVHRNDLPIIVIQLLTKIQQQASRLAKLVTNLIDVTSLESGSIKLNLQNCQIEEVINAAVIRVEKNKGSRQLGIEIQENLSPINIDRLLVEQVVVNLLDNAIRYTDYDGKLLVKATSDTQCLFVSVIDNGIGLLPGDEDKIFDKFYTHGHKTEGNAGLGLAICKGIITAHGGEISGANNNTGGANITFRLNY